jgi:DNA-binding LacI/PurR family transcriptional regulator
MVNWVLRKRNFKTQEVSRNMTYTKRVTSLEVARHAGVSRTTVSFVLNNVEGSSISLETRTKVQNAAKELGYIPNEAARSLVSGQTRTVGLVISHAEQLQVDAYIPQLLYSMTAASHQHGYQVMLETIIKNNHTSNYVRLVEGHRIDGLIVLNTWSHDLQLPKLLERKFPVVMLGLPRNMSMNDQTFLVEIDGRDAATRATKHLIDLGHSRIAHITFTPEKHDIVQPRRQGYKDALEAAGLVFDANLVRFGNYSAQSGFEAMKSLLQQEPRPTALFAGNDTIAMGAMAAIKAHGLRIPEDFAVVGFDDIPTAPFMSPALTTIHAPAITQGRTAIEMLLQRMQGNIPSKQRVILESPLVVRDSCGVNLKTKARVNKKR